VDQKSPVLKTIILLAGSFSFAFLLGEMIHEWGHLLAHRYFGVPGISYHLDPFGGSRIVGVKEMPLLEMGITSAAGPLLNLITAWLVSVLCWRRKKPAFLPFLIWGPVAMIQEGVNFSLGLLTPGGDGSWIIQSGVPGPALLTFGILLLLGGVTWLAWMLPVADVGEDKSFGSRYFTLLAGISALMVVRAAVSAFISQQAALENLIPLAFSLILSLVVVAIQVPLFNISAGKTLRQSAPIPWSVAAGAGGMAAGIFLLQIILP
jgi:hypothetical protein